MTDPCCLTALAEAASSPTVSEETDLQRKFVVFDKRDLVALCGC